MESLILLAGDNLESSSFSLNAVYLDDTDNLIPSISFLYLAFEWDMGDGAASYSLKLIQDPDSPYIEWARKIGHPDVEMEEDHPNLRWDKFIIADPSDDT